MGKPSKKSKKGSKNELDIILAQLKKAYIDDDASDFEEDNTSSSMSEEDYELNKLLEELFASPEDKNTVQDDKPDDNYINANTDQTFEPVTEASKEKNTEEIVEIEEAVSEDTVDDIEITTDTDSEENSEEAETNNESAQSSSLLDKIADDNDSEQDVEDILHLMFASNSSESGRTETYSPDTTEIEDTDTDEDTSFEQTVYKEESDNDENDLPWEEPSDNGNVTDAPLPLIEVENFADEDEDDEFIDEGDSIKFVNEIDNDEVEPSVIDEEYDISDNDEITVDESDPTIDITRPLMILDPSEYTSDPLQKRLPDLTARTKAADSIKRDNTHTSSPQLQNENDRSSDLDSNDISLLLKFGYDEEVKAKIGEEKTQEILIDKDKDFIPENHKIPYGFCGKELNDRSQLNEIKEKYKADRRTLVFTAILITVISVALIFLDVIFDFYISPNRSSYPFILIIDVLLVVLMALLLRKKLTSGVIDIIRFEATPYSILAFLMLAFVLCNLANGMLYLINAKTVNSSDLVLFGACMAFCTISILVSDLLNCQRDINTFDIISSSDTIYTAEKHKNPSEILTPEKRGENQHASSRFTDSKSYKIRKTSLISGYFRRMSHGDSKNVNIIYVLGIVPILSLIVGCVCAIVSGNIMKGVSSMMITTFLCTPLCYILLPTVTEFIASVILKKKNSSFIGAEAVSDYARTDCLFFSDTDAIEVLSYTEIHPSKSADEKENLEIAYRVFEALGGPLGEFAKKQGQVSDNTGAEVVINSISENGIEIYFDSSINILIGDRQFMSSNNIRVKTDSNLSNAIKGYDRSVIYMAFDGIPKLGFIITSKIKSDFASTVSTLDSNGIKVFVDTYEPQINDLYFEQNKTSISTAINVCKTEEYESSTQRPLCDGAIICTSNSLDIAETIVFSQRIIEQRKKHRRLHFALVAVGFILSCLFALLLNVNGPVLILAGLKIHITVLLSLIMLLMTIPGIISAYKLKKHEFNTKKREEKKK